MNIFEYGMQMEKDGEKFFRDLAEKCGDPGLANILTMLADAEIKHYDVLKQMRDKTAAKLAETKTLLSDSKNVFEQMKEAGGEFDFKSSQIELFKQAQEIERKSETFYLQKAEELEDPAQQEILKKIAAEEKQHFHLIGNIIEFVNSPNSWLENAEWHHLSDF